MKSVSEANDIAEKFASKQRVIKETPSIGGFKISQDNLKKREPKKMSIANESLGIFPFNPLDENYNSNSQFANRDSTNFTSMSNYRPNSKYGKNGVNNIYDSTQKSLSNKDIFKIYHVTMLFIVLYI